MRLSQRFLLGFLGVIVVLVALVVISVDRRLRSRLLEQTNAALLREAQLLAAAWAPGLNPDSLADTLGERLGHRITLVDSTGRVVGDSEFDRDALLGLENHAARPEVVAARRVGTGAAMRQSPSTGDQEVYAAVRHPLGVARVSLSIISHDALVSQVQRDVLSAALIAALIAVTMAAVLSRSVSKPILELRDDARAIAAGDLTRRPSLAAPGEVGELASAFHRLSEQLSARVRSLEADDALLRAVSDSLNEGVVALDVRQQVQHINDGARRLLGVQEAVPFSSDRLPRDRVFREALAAAMAGHASDDMETQLQERSVTLTARPLAGGGAVVALFDVTPIRRLETVRRDFVANVSHELKTPLTVVNGFAETLRDESVSAELRARFVETILSNTQRMQRLVDDLLDLSRIESGGWRPSPSTVDTAALAAEALAAVADAARAKGVTLAQAIDPGASEVRADAMAMRQVLANLVNNALRHTAAGGSITVFSEPGETGVVIGVRDTGSGIPAEHLPRIFERFYRVDASRSRAEGGTGLGLAIVRHLVEGHGGRVTAESRVGVGTTMRVILPGE